VKISNFLEQQKWRREPAVEESPEPLKQTSDDYIYVHNALRTPSRLRQPPERETPKQPLHERPRQASGIRVEPTPAQNKSENLEKVSVDLLRLIQQQKAMASSRHGNLKGGKYCEADLVVVQTMAKYESSKK